MEGLSAPVELLSKALHEFRVVAVERPDEACSAWSMFEAKPKGCATGAGIDGISKSGEPIFD
jgi:hypothetical protein